MRTYHFFRAIAIASLTAVLVLAITTDVAAKSLALQKPVAEGTSFLEEEAGISAYTNVGQAIDLEKVKGAFRTVEQETAEYIIGSVPLPDYGESEEAHAYVHKDGWIIVYYFKDDPTAKIIDWIDYSKEGKIKRTKLEIGISMICDAAGVPVKDAKYYHFKCPDANKVMIIAGSSFNIKLPGDLIFYERSFSCRSGEFYIDGQSIGTSILSPTRLSVDVFHAIKFTGFGAIVLVYKEL